MEEKEGGRETEERERDGESVRERKRVILRTDPLTILFSNREKMDAHISITVQEQDTERFLHIEQAHISLHIEAHTPSPVSHTHTHKHRGAACKRRYTRSYSILFKRSCPPWWL